MSKGMTLEQVQAAKPTRDYDGLYGKNASSWTPDMFVAAVYKSLGAAARSSQKSTAPKGAAPRKK